MDPLVEIWSTAGLPGVSTPCPGNYESDQIGQKSRKNRQKSWHLGINPLAEGGNSPPGEIFPPPKTLRGDVCQACPSLMSDAPLLGYLYGKFVTVASLRSLVHICCQ